MEVWVRAMIPEDIFDALVSKHTWWDYTNAGSYRSWKFEIKGHPCILEVCETHMTTWRQRACINIDGDKVCVYQDNLGGEFHFDGEPSQTTIMKLRLIL